MHQQRGTTHVCNANQMQANGGVGQGFGTVKGDPAQGNKLHGDICVQQA